MQEAEAQYIGNEGGRQMQKSDPILLPDPFIRALESYGGTFAIVNCQGYIKKEISWNFAGLLYEEWEKACKLIAGRMDKEDVAWYSGQDMPFVGTKDNGRCLVMYFAPVAITYGYGQFCEVDSALAAVEDSFSRMQEKYPDITYTGYVAFPWHDKQHTGAVNYTFGDIGGGDAGISTEAINKELGDILTKAVDDTSVIGLGAYGGFLGTLKEELGQDPGRLEDTVKFLWECKDYMGDREFVKLCSTCIIALKESRSDTGGLH